MNPLVAQQVALDDALVAPDNRVVIGKCNMRIEPTKTQKEATYQVALDTLKHSPCYQAFLVTTDVLEIYMHQFWFRIFKIKDSPSYQFKLDKKKFRISIDNRQTITARRSSMPYPRFIKEIIQHFISKDKTISTRNNLLMHSIKNDSVLGLLKFISKYKENQVYGKPILDVMLSKEIMETMAYKTYLAFATRKAIPKKARKRTKAYITPMKESSLIADDNIISNILMLLLN
nr:hypothetical protein [Tanacetum cinerariifolium]